MKNVAKKIYYKRKNSGLCVECGEPKDNPKATRCNKCIQAHKNYYDFYKKHHICVKCRRNDALPNRVVCEGCSEKRSKRYYNYVKDTPEEKKIKDTNKRNARRRELSKLRKEHGLCPKCGKPSLKGHIRCLDCCLKGVRESKERREKEKFSEPIGCCYRCSNPCIPGKKLCKEHYEQVCNALESARNSRSGIEARKEHKKKYDAFWDEMKYKGDKNVG